MVLHVRIDVSRLEHQFVGEALERVVHALRRLAGLGQETHAGAVGVFFLGALVGEQRCANIGLRRLERSRRRCCPCCVAGTGARRQRADAEQHGDDRGGLRVGEFLAHLGQMPADDVSGFVGKDADDLVGRLRFHQRAGIDEDVMRVHHEGVERSVVDDDNVDVLVAKPGDLENGLRVIAQQLLDLGVANDRDAGVRRRSAPVPGGSPNANAAAVAKRHSARSWPRPPRLARRLCSDHLGQRLIPRSGTQAMDGAGRGQHKAGAFAAAKQAPRNRANTAAWGRADVDRRACLCRKSRRIDAR